MGESQLSGDDSETIDLEDMHNEAGNQSKEPAETPENAAVEVSAKEIDEGDSDSSGGEPNEDSESSAGNSSGKHTWLIVAALGLITVLIIVGLFLPPVSLGERLGLSGDDADEVSESAEDSESVESSVDAQGATVYLSESDDEVDIEQVSQDEFTSGEAGRKWESALAAIPQGLAVASDVYGLEGGDEAVVGSVEIVVPTAAQPIQTLDLYGWNGESWNFVPNNIVGQGESLRSVEDELPQALVLMQTSAPDALEIGDEHPGQGGCRRCLQTTPLSVSQVLSQHLPGSVFSLSRWEIQF